MWPNATKTTEELMDERRDDTNLDSLICPHCKQTLPVLKIRAFEKQQLLYMKCDLCGKGITKQQIDETYREYRNNG